MTDDNLYLSDILSDGVSFFIIRPALELYYVILLFV